MRPLPRRHEPNPLHDPVAIVALAIAAFLAVGGVQAECSTPRAPLSGCSETTLNRIDPPLPVNANTYKPCPNVPWPGCRTDDQECPIEGTVCTDLPPRTCESGPCPNPVMQLRFDGGAPPDAAR